ncbi:Endopolyphosphatase [Kickxella alabastrina]|nr:Endopolyphosphatase [Kickxella alabastrina]
MAEQHTVPIPRPARETTALLNADETQQKPRHSRSFVSRRSIWTVISVAALTTLAVVGTSVVLLLSKQYWGASPSTDSSARLNSRAVGRFLHITDLHVDPYYVEGSTTYSQCHRKPPTLVTSPQQQLRTNRRGNKDGHQSTGRYGVAEAKCDSPVALINVTSEYLRQMWADQLDFVIWTGDSGRHDGDAELPRTFDEIIEQNYITAAAMRHAFKQHRIPIVPNIGNNDISPHNELGEPGHKRAKKTFKQLADAWDGFIPQNQLATFLHAGYFAHDVVDYDHPKSAVNKGGKRGLTALSLNTIYWYRANAKVGGCRAEDSPGLEQLAWIRYQIRRARQRNRDLILMGHVVPSRDNYRPTCYHGYARTVTQVIPPPPLAGEKRADAADYFGAGGDNDREKDLPLVHAQLFGHSNVDVWSFVGQEIEWVASKLPLGNATSEDSTDEGVKDKRLWWEREVDEETGRFGRLIRDVWMADKPLAEHTAAVEGRTWADMEDDPAVRFVKDSRGAIWPAVSQDAQDGVSGMALPGDFVESLLKEFEQVLVRTPRGARLGVTTISPSIIPKYFPAFRVFYYAHGPSNGKWRDLPLGTLLDYDVFWANLDMLNTKGFSSVRAFFAPLYRFSEVYGIDDLSIDSYFLWARKLLSSKSLRKRFRALTYLDT